MTVVRSISTAQLCPEFNIDFVLDLAVAMAKATERKSEAKWKVKMASSKCMSTIS